MQFAKGAEHGRPEPQRAGPARVEPGGRVGCDLDVLRRRAHCGEGGERIGFDVVKIGLASGGTPVLWAGMPAAHAGGGEHLTLRRVIAIERPEFEQCHIGEAAIGVAACRGDQPRQQGWPHRIEIGADRVDETQFGLGAPEQIRLARRDERERHRFRQPALGERAAHQLGPALLRRQCRTRQRGCPFERDRRDLVVALDAQYLLDEIGLADDVAAPRRRLDREIASRDSLDLAAERGEDLRALLMRYVKPAERCRPLGAQHVSAPPIGHGAGRDDLRRLAAAQLKHQPRGNLQPVPDKGRVEAALEAIAGIACNVELAPGRRGADRVEERRLDEDLGRRFGTCRRLTADHAPEALDAGRLGNDRNFRIERVFLPVEGEQGFARPRQTDRKIAGEPARIKHVKRPVEVEGQKVRDVDEGRDRPQTNRFELVLQPGRARPVMDPAKVPAEKERTRGTVFNRDAYWRPETPGDGSLV